MKLVIQIDLDNAAFETNRTAEIEALFRRIVERLPETGSTAFAVRDLNGNVVGDVEIKAS